jgi:hypothetical protein
MRTAQKKRYVGFVHAEFLARRGSRLPARSEVAARTSTPYREANYATLDAVTLDSPGRCSRSIPAYNEQ